MNRLFVISLLFLFSISAYPHTSQGIVEYKKGMNHLKKYKKSGDRLSLRYAIMSFKKSADNDNSDACYCLYKIYSLICVGDIYIDPRDVEWVEGGNWSKMTHNQWPTNKTGINYLKKASELGNLDATADLAFGYYTKYEWAAYVNDSWENNRKKAYKLCLENKASENNTIEYVLGRIYQDGDIVPKDYMESISWFKKAYSHGDESVSFKIGYLYYQQQDYLQSEEYLEKYFNFLKHEKSINSLFSYEPWKVMLWVESCVGINDFEKAISIINKYLTPKITNLSGKDIKLWNLKKSDLLYEFEGLIENFYQENGDPINSPILKHIYSIDNNPSPDISYVRAQNIIMFRNDYCFLDREVYFKDALRWLEKAKPFKNEVGSFCIWVGKSFEDNNNIFKAKEWYERAISNGELYGYRRLAQLYEMNSAELPDETHIKAFECWSKFAETNVYGLYQVGRYYEDGKISAPNIDQAMHFYRLAAEKDSGNVSLYSMDNLASCYIQKKEWKDAFVWLNKAYERGFLPVCHNLGDLYFFGNGTSQSYQKAYDIFTKGMSDNPICKYRVAMMLREGLGVNKDIEQSNSLLQEAADSCVSQAQYVLGIILYSGDGITQNYATSIQYLNDALKDNHLPLEVRGESYRILSACYRFGRGVTIDEVKADEYMRLASECGNPDAKKIQEWMKININD